jgi:long-chain fatty acid transport protein
MKNTLSANMSKVFKTAIMATAIAAPVSAFASGFYIIEQSAALQGNGFAGAAAIAEDASTNFYNAAGLVYLDSEQIQTGVSYVSFNAEYLNQGTYNSVSGALVEGDSDDGGTNAMVPTLYYAKPINERVAFGFGINAPFGLVTEYDEDWVGRYTAITSDLKCYDFNPNIAYRVTDKLSVSLGLVVEYSDAELSNAIDFSTVIVGSVANGTIPSVALPEGYFNYSYGNLGKTVQDGKATVSGDSLDFGFTVGLMYEFDPTLRIGVNYRSKIHHELEGDVDFELPDDAVISALFGNVFYDQALTADLTVPESISLSVYKSYKKWEFLADVTWMNWSRFELLYLDFEDAVTPDSSIEERWQDVVRGSIGANYQLNEKWKLRVGFVYDQSPCEENNYRSPRIPDEDRTWVSTGVTYKYSENMTFSAGFTYIFVDDPQITNATHTSGNVLLGKYDASVHILTMGMTYNF